MAPQYSSPELGRQCLFLHFLFLFFFSPASPQDSCCLQSEVGCQGQAGLGLCDELVSYHRRTGRVMPALLCGPPAVLQQAVPPMCRASRCVERLPACSELSTSTAATEHRKQDTSLLSGPCMRLLFTPHFPLIHLLWARSNCE